MLLNKTKILALISGLALSGLVSACSNNQAAQSTQATAEGAAAQSSVQTEQTVAASTETTPALPPEDKDIGAERAKEIALEKAEVKAEDTLFINVHLDREDGRVEYEVEFQSGNTEYEVSVDAITGEINEFSSEEADN